MKCSSRGQILVCSFYEHWAHPLQSRLFTTESEYVNIQTQNDRYKCLFLLKNARIKGCPLHQGEEGLTSPNPIRITITITLIKTLTIQKYNTTPPATSPQFLAPFSNTSMNPQLQQHTRFQHHRHIQHHSTTLTTPSPP